MIKLNSLTFTLASNNYGHGHLKRMINLNAELKKNDIKNEIIFFSNEKLVDYKKSKNINFTQIDKFLSKKNMSFCILDLSNKVFFKKKIFDNLISLFVKYRTPLIIFDDFSNKIWNILNIINQKSYVVCPYIYKNNFIKQKKKYFLNLKVGPKFAILKKTSPQIKKNTRLKNILISCGGSDFKKLTHKLMMILNKYKELKVSVIIGPHFDRFEKIKINKLKSNNVKIFRNISNILPIAKKHDLAIITSGLTKYELLSINMNFAVISENKSFYQFHKPFVKKKLCYDLGYFKNLKKLGDNINFLINHYEKVFKNKTQKKLIDFKGTSRIVGLIKNNFN